MVGPQLSFERIQDFYELMLSLLVLISMGKQTVQCTYSGWKEQIT